MAAAPLAQPVGVTLEILLHPAGGVQRALRMILVGHRGAEQREDAITGRLSHIAFVTMHRVHHQLKRGIHDRARLFGIEVLDQLHRALDVGEQRGDRLALAVERFRRATLRHDAHVGG
jgi:hypothetical protein